MTETLDELEELLRAFDRDRSYTTERLIKENDLERTELVRDASGKRYVRKYIAVDEGKVHPYERLAGVDCPYLQKVLETQHVGGKLVVVCEYVEGLDLRTFVEKFGAMSSDTAYRHAGDLCEALAVLHNLPGGSVVHRDVNPGNIVITNGKAVLIDLGIARVRNNTENKDTHVWGTSGYAAPEQFGFRQTDARTDIYGLGMCLRFMMTGAEPGDQKAALPAATARIVDKATSLDPADRYASAHDMRDALLLATGPATPSATPEMHGDVTGGWTWEDGTWREPKTVGARPQAGVGPLGALEARLVGMTHRSNTVRSLWHIYQAIVASTLFLLVASIGVVLQSDDNLHSKFLYIQAVVFVFIVPGLFSINFAYMNDYNPLLAKHRHVKIALICIGAVLLAMAIVTIFAAAGYEYTHTSVTGT